MRIDILTLDYWKGQCFLFSLFTINDNKSLFSVNYVKDFCFDICLFYKVIYFKDLEKK